MLLLSPPSSNVKLSKTQANTQTLVYGLSLSAHSLASQEVRRATGEQHFTTCPDSTPGCRAACVVSASANAQFASVQESRNRKTVFLQTHRQEFIRLLKSEIQTQIDRAGFHGHAVRFRLNVDSSIPWHAEEYGQIPQSFPDARFYDYHPLAALNSRRHWKLTDIPPNLRICWSRKESDSWQTVESAISDLQNVAVVFHDDSPHRSSRGAYAQPLPRFVELPSLGKWPVIDGDHSDDRTDDPQGLIVGLRLKSRSEQIRTAAIRTGFSVPTSAAPCIL
jgi:hypothetical protein